MTSMGKYRHLSHCSTEAGHFVILAIDHRANLLEKLNEVAKRQISDEEFLGFKQLVLQNLSPFVSAVLTDPAFGIGQAIKSRTIRGQMGLLAPVEVTNYGLHPGKRDIEYIPNWSVAKLKAIGGDGIKLLLPYHHKAANVNEKYEVVQRLVEECQQADIPFFLEPIAYSLDVDKHLSNGELLEISVEMASRFSAMAVDILKLAFPVDSKQSQDEQEWFAACRAVNAACTVPWALLSGGVSYEVFRKQAEIACRSGASGVIVGRAIWDEAVLAQEAERENFLATKAQERIKELGQICLEHAHPWFERVAAPNAALNWYESYNQENLSPV
jgi:tagatose 1,6-diphosphate aldolase